MLTKADIAGLFSVEESNISAYSDKKTANLRWETNADREWELNQEVLITVHLKQVIWDSKIRNGGTSKLQLSFWMPIPYHFPQRMG